MGYLPPNPSPFLRTRTLKAVAHEIRAEQVTSDVQEALSTLEQEHERRYAFARGFLDEMSKCLTVHGRFVSHVKALLQQSDPAINRTSISIEIPAVSPALIKRMLETERFLAHEWSDNSQRGILAVHVDEENQTTILQIGVAEHGPVYISIPRILRPEEVALNSIRKLIERIEPFQQVVDPMAVIDGSYQALNYNYLFRKSRVIRAPSGNTERLMANIRETARRERVSPDNTAIINCSPATLEEYQRVFPKDKNGRHWAAWGDEAERWNHAIAHEQFGVAAEAGQADFVAALTQKQNVVVIVAHCDGNEIFMPDPPPEGTQVTAEYLLQNREQIAANAPFVYLFSCEAGNISNLKNFASTLLDSGAAGVIASQTTLGAAEGRNLLGRLLGKQRRAPPIEDFWQAMHESKYFDMEVFLA
jgi:hypothetical protein